MGLRDRTSDLKCSGTGPPETPRPAPPCQAALRRWLFGSMTAAANPRQHQAEARPDMFVAFSSLVYPELWFCAIPPAWHSTLTFCLTLDPDGLGRSQRKMCPKDEPRPQGPAPPAFLCGIRKVEQEDLVPKSSLLTCHLVSGRASVSSSAQWG